jgi:hypothetical protein
VCAWMIIVTANLGVPGSSHLMDKQVACQVERSVFVYVFFFLPHPCVARPALRGADDSRARGQQLPHHV